MTKYVIEIHTQTHRRPTIEEALRFAKALIDAGVWWFDLTSKE